MRNKGHLKVLRGFPTQKTPRENCLLFISHPPPPTRLFTKRITRRRHVHTYLLRVQSGHVHYQDDNRTRFWRALMHF